MSQNTHTAAASRPDAILPFALAGQHLQLAIFTCDDKLCGIEFVGDEKTLDPCTALAEKAVRQLETYLDDPQHPFDLPLHMQGTDFQRRLWAALREIPAGDTATYGQLVKRLGMKGGAQAVGQACRRNPVPIVVPCHRILSQSSMGGYAGETEGEKFNLKRALLKHEGVVCG
jgi:methylated-DNA-[protein]-cysteine S-methyltransferase